MTKSAVITGANRGIGLSLSKHYLSLGWRVYAVCRQSSPELDASGAIVIAGVDVSSASDIQTLVQNLEQKLGGEPIGLLINNAGILRDEVLGHLNFETIQSQFEVNALGPIRVTEALQSQLSQGAKIAMITSRMGSVADNTSGGRYGYRMSKAALNIAAVSLSHDLKHQGVAVAVIHPGLVGTDMIGSYGDITPDQAAARIVDRINDLNLDNSGSFWHSNGERLPW